MDIKFLDEKLIWGLWWPNTDGWHFLGFLKRHAWTKIIFLLLRGRKWFHCNQNIIFLNYYYITSFSINIHGFTRYFKVPKLKIVVILYFTIFSRNVCPFHDDFSTENITIFTWGYEKSLESCNCKLRTLTFLKKL